MSDKEYTLEELNYFRVCYITTSIIRDGLQSVFKQEWDRIHGWSLGPWKDTAKNGQDFFNMESPGSRRRNNRLLRIIQNGNTNEWDPTCFFFAILFSDSLGPLVSPTVAVNVDTLRVFRNGFFAHLSQASILETDFQANMKLVSNAFTALHLDTKQLQRIGNQRSFPTDELQQLREKISVLEEELQEPKSFMCLPPKPSHEVTERKSEADEIMRKFKDLQETSDDGSIVTVYAYGNPGCGKSQIARDVGKKLYDEAVAGDDQEGCTFVMTLNAESEQSMLDSYYKFARELGVTEYSLNSITVADSNLKPGQRISHLKTLVCAKVRHYSNWLIIFDNANELESLRNCCPDEEWGGCGKVLVTTQDSMNLPPCDPSCDCISLSRGMQMDDALSLLRRISRLSCDDEELEHSVVKALDSQALAIACAALYVRYLHAGLNVSGICTGSSTWKNYLKKLEMGKRHLTEKVYERTSNSYPLSMTSAVTIAVEKMVQNDVFRQVFLFLGLGAPEPIDLDIIVSFVTKQDPALDKDTTAADIAKCSLLIPLVKDDIPRTRIEVHQVVHDVFKRLLDKCSIEEFTALIQRYIETLSPFAEHNLFQFDLEFHISAKMMAPHLKSLTSYLGRPFNWISPDVSGDEKLELKNALLNFGDICSTHGHLGAAKTLFEHALKIASDESDGNDENGTKSKATILNNLGIVCRKQGKFRRAKDLHEGALALLESLNPGNPTSEIADSLNKLGNVFYSLEQFEEAKNYYCRSLAMRENIFGSEHATVAASLNNLGCVYTALGNHQIAEDYYQRSLTLEEKICGKLHPHVADCLCNLGIVYSELGASEKAIQYHNRALEMRKQLYLPDNFLISQSYNNLGLMYKGVGQLEKAMTCLESALRIREKVLDKNHHAMAELLNNLGQLHMDRGESQKSKEFHYQALHIRLKIFGRNHCKLADSMLNLGLVHEECFEFHDAASFFKDALEIYNKHYPLTHQLCQSTAEGLKRVSQLKHFEQPGEQDGPDCKRAKLTRRKKLTYSGVNWGPKLRGAIPPRANPVRPPTAINTRILLLLLLFFVFVFTVLLSIQLCIFRYYGLL